MTLPRGTGDASRRIVRRLGSASSRGFTILRDLIVDFANDEERVQLPRLQLLRVFQGREVSGSKLATRPSPTEMSNVASINDAE